MKKKRVVLAGGSGFLGRALQADLESAGYETVVLTRSPRRVGDVRWDGKTVGEWATHLEGAYAVVNLAGKSVNCRYTPANRREIVLSRVDSVIALDNALRDLKNPPSVWVQCSSLAIYGDSGDAIRTEDSPHGPGLTDEDRLAWNQSDRATENFKANFSVDVCEAWEAGLADPNFLPPGMRGVTLRIGFVLGEKGGALGTLGWLTKMFLGSAVGSGRQYISWLHLRDMNRIFRFSIENEEAQGVFNATGPNPVTNAQFMASLRRALHRPWSPPVPAPFVKIATRLMQTEAELALIGRRCVPKRLLESGFKFEFSELDAALKEIYASSSSK
ncbi:DUF1731 domain-containing protein [bacterium]|nr:MAG: DUF1731 domain-containing protein [bacterium]